MKQDAKKDIGALYHDYLQIKDYNNRLAFYDKHFNILPVKLPGFHPKLNFLFDTELLASINKAYKEETGNKDLFVKRVQSNEALYVFDVTPEFSTRIVFNKHILNKFMKDDACFNAYIKSLSASEKKHTDKVMNLKKEAIALIDYIKLKQNEADKKTNRDKYLKVFLEGFTDSKNEAVRSFRLKRKLIEMWLYAQGVLYENYLKKLDSILNNETVLASDAEDVTQKSISNKISLLKKLGILEFLFYKYSYMESKDLNNKIGEIVCKITGVNLSNKVQVIKQLDRKK